MAVCVGCGLSVDTNGVLNVKTATGGCLNCDNTNGLSVVVSPTGHLTCSGTGLAWTGATVGDTATVDMNGDGITTPITANVIRSGVACNGLQLRGDGVWAQCPQEFTCSNNTGFFGGTIPVALNTGGAATFNLTSQCVANSCSTCPAGINGRIHYCNPSTCCAVEGFYDIQAYGGFITANPGFNATVIMFVSINGGAFVTANPLTTLRITNQGPAVQQYDLPNFWERNYVVLDPVGGVNNCVDLQALIRIHVDAGTASWDAGPNFEFHFGPLVGVQGCCG